MVNKKPIKNVWGWLEEITLTKSPTNSFTEEDWGQFNAYTLHKALSMNPNYLEIANLAQIIIGKQRHGPTGNVDLEFEAMFTKFKDIQNS